jgi:hypothetical protein
MDLLHKIHGISSVAWELLATLEGRNLLAMPQAESRAHSLVALEVFHCVPWTATRNFLFFLKFSDSGRYKNRGPKKKDLFLNIVVTTL